MLVFVMTVLATRYEPIGEDARDVASEGTMIKPRKFRKVHIVVSHLIDVDLRCGMSLDGSYCKQLFLTTPPVARC
jgi:hypothetical protein